MLAFANGVTALAIEKVHFRDSDNKERWVSGEILVEAQNGGMMIQADDSRIWMIQPSVQPLKNLVELAVATRKALVDYCVTGYCYAGSNRDDHR